MQLASGRAPLIPLPMLATLLVLLSTPLWVGRVGLYQYLALEIMIWVLFALGYNLLLGFTGLPSFGHGAFFGTGAYAFGLLQLKVWPNLWFDLAGAVLVTAALGALVALFISHRRGIYYALLTIAFGQVFWFIANKWHTVTGGEDGLLNIKRLPADFGFVSFNLVGQQRPLLLLPGAVRAGAAGPVAADPFAAGPHLQRHQAERNARGLCGLQRLALQVAGLHASRPRWRAWPARCSPWRSSRPTPTS